MKGCDNCYYESFDEKAYPCSLCIRGIKRTDKWMPKIREMGLKEVKALQDYYKIKGEPPKMGSVKRPKTGICAKCGRDDCEQKMEHIDNCNGYIAPQSSGVVWVQDEKNIPQYTTTCTDEPQTERSNNE